MNRELLQSILDKAVDAIGAGQSPESFFEDITRSGDGGDIRSIAERFCQSMGSELNTVLNEILH